MDTSKVIIDGKGPHPAYWSRRGDVKEGRLPWPFSIQNPQKDAVETEMPVIFGFLCPIIIYLVLLSLVSESSMCH